MPRFLAAHDRRVPAPGTTRALTAAVAILATAGIAALDSVASERRVAGAQVAAPSAARVADPAASRGAAGPRPTSAAQPTTAAAAGRHGPAYWLAGADGGTMALGWAKFAGSLSGRRLRAPVVGIAQTPSGDGYWLASADGGVFAYGDAAFAGSAGGAPLSAPITAIAATPTGRGYWLVSRDGGVFAFGDAAFLGSAAGANPAGGITGIAPTRDGRGYWLVSGDGGVFAFGNAPFLGAAVAANPRGGITGVTAAPTGRGYWLVSRDGGVFAFGDAGFHGAAVGATRAAVVDIAASPSGGGYWLVAADGGVFSFGDAPFLGSLAGRRLNAPVVAIAGGTGTTTPAPPPPPPAPPVTTTGWVGYDISYPQCNRPSLPTSPFTVVGVTGGRAFRENRCLKQQWEWARRVGAAAPYVNVNFPRGPEELAAGATGPQGHCAGALPCIAYHFGWNGIAEALRYGRSQGVDAPFWWLDVETMNYWTPDRALNAVVLRGAIDALRSQGLGVGIYSTPYQWNVIAGDFQPGLPTWVATGPGNGSTAPAACARTFGGGTTYMVQWVEDLDRNLLCPVARNEAIWRR